LQAPRDGYSPRKIEHQFATSLEVTMAEQELRGSNVNKDPDEWKTGDEPMTGAQASYLKTLSDQADEAFDETLSKAEASRRIEQLQSATGRGRT
jgi:Protein of unknown function (DUF3072)